MPKSPEPLPAAFLRRPVTVADALRAGIGYERLRRADLDGRIWGIRCTAPLDALGAQAAALLERMRDGTVVSHETAALLLRLPLPPGRGTKAVHLTVGDGRAPHANGIAGHRRALGIGDVALVSRIAVTSVARTIMDLAPTLELDDLVALIDAAARRDQSVVAELEERSRTARRGVRRLRQALELADAGSRSPQESRLRVRLVVAGLPRPAVNVVVRDRFGRFIGVADLYFPDYGIVIEYESEHHRTDPLQWRKDLRRFSRYTAAGYKPLRATIDDVVSPRALLADIREIIAHHG